MESFGIVKAMGSVGRIVLPKSLRQRFKIKYGDDLEIAIDGDSIILSKYRHMCAFCGGTDSVIKYRDGHICQECLSSLTQQA